MTEQSTVNQTAAKPVPTLPDAQTVTSVTHWTDQLFSFRVSRPASLRFRSGEFVMIGLMGDPHPETGKQKPVGTLVHDALLPGDRLWMFATGTGFAPFASLLREPETYEKFDEVIVTHTCRDVAELEYGRQLIEGLKADELMQELIGPENLAKIRYYPTTTREESPKMGRITNLLQDGTVFKDLGVPQINAAHDRAMVCGSLGFNKDIMEILEGFGLTEGANSDPQHFVVEKAFVG